MHSEVALTAISKMLWGLLECRIILKVAPKNEVYLSLSEQDNIYISICYEFMSEKFGKKETIILDAAENRKHSFVSARQKVCMSEMNT